LRYTGLGQKVTLSPAIVSSFRFAGFFHVTWRQA